MFAIVLLVLSLVSSCFCAISAYNRLVSLKNQVANAWKQIDVQLKRRHDLIPEPHQHGQGSDELREARLSKQSSRPATRQSPRPTAATSRRRRRLRHSSPAHFRACSLSSRRIPT